MNKTRNAPYQLVHAPWALALKPRTSTQGLRHMQLRLSGILHLGLYPKTQQLGPCKMGECSFCHPEQNMEHHDLLNDSLWPEVIPPQLAPCLFAASRHLKAVHRSAAFMGATLRLTGSSRPYLHKSSRPPWRSQRCRFQASDNIRGSNHSRASRSPNSTCSSSSSALRPTHSHRSAPGGHSPTKLRR